MPIVGPPEVLAAKGTRAHFRLDEVIISMPSASPERLREVINVFQFANRAIQLTPVPLRA